MPAMASAMVLHNLNNNKMSQIQLTDDQVLEIDFISTEKYKDKLSDGKTDNKLAGQEYHRFRYANKIFTTRDANFTKAINTGDLFKVTLEEVTDEDSGAVYIQLVSFITYTKKTGLEMNKSRLRAVANMDFTPSAVTAELLQDIA
jgi:hypothetical protein